MQQTIYTLLGMWCWLIAGFNGYQLLFPAQIDTTPTPHIVKVLEEKDVIQKITLSAGEAGISVDTALRIANCESKMGTQLYNKQGSSAKGVFMFIDKTWNNYCEGNVLDEDDNIKCFMDLYPKHPSWWKCR